MMGRTHALGGAAAMAAASLLLPENLRPTAGGALLVAGSFLLATASALVPDADNDRGSLMNRPYLMPLKVATFPLWWGAPHRGRTHSIIGLAVYTALIIAWVLAFQMAMRSWVDPTFTLPKSLLVSIGMAAGVGYASHVFLDLFNLLGQTLFWPNPAKFVFPIWRAHEFIPGRFAAGSKWERWLVWPFLAAFTGWYVLELLRTTFIH